MYYRTVRKYSECNATLWSFLSDCSNFEIITIDFIIFISIILIILIILVIIAIQFYRIKKSKHQLLEKDYTRIYDELLLLSQKMNKKNDFEKYNLKERQLEVIDLLRKGKSNKQIAEQLFISENTVKYHLQKFLNKMQLNKVVGIQSLHLFR